MGLKFSVGAGVNYSISQGVQERLFFLPLPDAPASRVTTEIAKEFVEKFSKKVDRLKLGVE